MTAAKTSKRHTDDPLLWGVTRCAAELGLSVQYVRRLADQGDLPFVRIGTRKMFPSADIKAWIESKKIAAVKR